LKLYTWPMSFSRFGCSPRPAIGGTPVTLALDVASGPLKFAKAKGRLRGKQPKLEPKPGQALRITKASDLVVGLSPNFGNKILPAGEAAYSPIPALTFWESTSKTNRIGLKGHFIFGRWFYVGLAEVVSALRTFRLCHR
jgi:hypothetical protein